MKREKRNFDLTPERRRILKYTALALCLVLPLGYVFFFSESNITRHRELQSEKRKLQEDIRQARNYLSNHYTYEQIMQTPKLFDKYVREQLNMKKENEDVYIID